MNISNITRQYYQLNLSSTVLARRLKILFEIRKIMEYVGGEYTKYNWEAIKKGPAMIDWLIHQQHYDLCVTFSVNRLTFIWMGEVICTIYLNFDGYDSYEEFNADVKEWLADADKYIAECQKHFDSLTMLENISDKISVYVQSECKNLTPQQIATIKAYVKWS